MCPAEPPEISDEDAECCYDWLLDDPCYDCPVDFGEWGVWRALLAETMEEARHDDM